jgi:levansucrase
MSISPIHDNPYLTLSGAVRMLGLAVLVLALTAGCIGDSDDDNDVATDLETPATTETPPAAESATTPVSDTTPAVDPVTPDAETTAATDDSAPAAPGTTPPPATATPDAPDSSPTPDIEADADRIDDVASAWTAEHVEAIEYAPENVAPLVDPDRTSNTLEGYHVWDWWPVRDRNGEVSEIGGWKIIVALTADDGIVPGARHDFATHRLLLSTDGSEWQDGGRVFPEGSELGTRQWAGSAMYDADQDQIYFFYTAAGRGENEPSVEEAHGPPDTEANVDEDIYGYFEQRMVMARADVSPNDNGIDLSNWTDHYVVGEADGQWYETTHDTEGGAGNITGFRDPEYFFDERTGEEYLTFTANLAGSDCEFNGVVGLARATSDDLSEWELLPPILHADCVNQELERPHFVVLNERFYLFFSTHEFTFADGLTGPEGLFGFVADDIRGDYTPLNESGLILANPEEDPWQTYSWLVLNNLWVTSFHNTFDVGDRSWGEISAEDDEWQFEHFGGNLAPALLIEIDNTSARIVEETYDYGDVFE